MAVAPGRQDEHRPAALSFPEIEAALLVEVSEDQNAGALSDLPAGVRLALGEREAGPELQVGPGQTLLQAVRDCDTYPGGKQVKTE